MEPVADLEGIFLEAEGRRYVASAPEWGDATVETEDRPGSADVFERPEQEGRVTVGLLPTEIDGLETPVDAVLRTRSGRRLLALHIDKVSPELNVAVGTPLTVH